MRHACDSSPFHTYVCILYCIFFLTFTPHWENLFLLFEAQKNWARQLKSVTPFTGSCVWGGYILSNMPGPNLESIFHRQQKYICVAFLHFSKFLKEGGGALLQGFLTNSVTLWNTEDFFVVLYKIEKKILWYVKHNMYYEFKSFFLNQLPGTVSQYWFVSYSKPPN